jgi:hypothetical protein
VSTTRTLAIAIAAVPQTRRGSLRWAASAWQICSADGRPDNEIAGIAELQHRLTQFYSGRRYD